MRSHRLDELPPYLFVEIDRLKDTYRRSGREVLDLGIGDPDIGAPPELIERLRASLEQSQHHRYPPDRGLPGLTEAICRWARKYYGVSLNDDEVLVTIGSKEAIGHLPLAIADFGDVVLVPDPGYPVYYSSAVLAGARPVRFPLEESNRYWPDFESFDPTAVERSTLLYLNYPNNPTAAVAGFDQFREALEWCRLNGIVLVHDAAYSEITYGSRAAVLFPVARDSGVPYIELFSFSKTFSITGWRVGFAIGSPDVVSALAAVKANLDSGVFGAVQEAVAGVLENHFELITSHTQAIYRERRDLLARSLERAGLSFTVPQATFYFWIRIPDGNDSISFCRSLLEETGIVATPGVGFGVHGEGFFRLSITTDIDTIREAGKRLEARSARFGAT